MIKIEYVSSQKRNKIYKNSTGRRVFTESHIKIICPKIIITLKLKLLRKSIFIYLQFTIYLIYVLINISRSEMLNILH